MALTNNARADTPRGTGPVRKQPLPNPGTKYDRPTVAPFDDLDTAIATARTAYLAGAPDPLPTITADFLAMFDRLTDDRRQLLIDLATLNLAQTDRPGFDRAQALADAARIRDESAAKYGALTRTVTPPAPPGRPPSPVDAEPGPLPPDPIPRTT